MLEKYKNASKSLDNLIVILEDSCSLSKIEIMNQLSGKNITFEQTSTLSKLLTKITDELKLIHRVVLPVIIKNLESSADNPKYQARDLASDIPSECKRLCELSDSIIKQITQFRDLVDSNNLAYPGTTKYDTQSLQSKCEMFLEDFKEIAIVDNTYETVKIGKQEWMTKNLNVSNFRNGDSIPEAKSSDEWVAAGRDGTPAWCYYENNLEYGEKYGKLYNWFAINDPRGLAPEGWHIPSDAEWQTLVDYLGGSSVAGDKIKDTMNWSSRNSDATNESGFAALPGGRREYNGNFIEIGSEANFWSSTEQDRYDAWYRDLYCENSEVGRYNQDKQRGFSVRCIRD